MTTRKLERAQWQQYFDDVAKRVPAMRVAVSVMGEDLGVQPGTEDASLIGISYDHNDDILTIDTPNMSHRVTHPSEIYVREEAGTLTSIEAMTSDGTKQVIELKPLPALPAS